MQFLEDIISFVKSLSMIDIILYFAVLVLIILIISLIYVIKTSEEENDEEEKKPHQTISFPKFKIKQEEEKETKDAIDLKDIVTTFKLTEQEEKMILNANVGECLFMAGIRKLYIMFRLFEYELEMIDSKFIRNKEYA